MFNRLKSLFSRSAPQEIPAPEPAVDRAAEEFVELIIGHLGNEKGVNIETAITAAGSMAGFLLLRATGVDLSKLNPGTAVFVDEVNETGPAILGFMSAACVREGIESTTGWGEHIANQPKPLVSGIDLVRDLYPKFRGVAERCGIPEKLRPQIAAAAAIKLTRMGSQALSPEKGKSIALWSMLSASKTVPHHF